MKVTIEFTEFQMMKALARTPATEEQSERIMSAIRETPELDITEHLKYDEDYKEVSLVIAISAIAAICENRSLEFA